MGFTAAEFPAGTPNRLDMRIGCYALFGLSSAIILLRIYVRLFKRRTLGLDDFFVFVAWLCQTVHIVAVKGQFDAGVGFHLFDIVQLKFPLSEMLRLVENVALWSWIAQLIYYTEVAAIKASVIALYLRLTIVPARRWVLWAALAVVITEGLSCTLIIAIACVPTETAIKSGEVQNCVKLLDFTYFSAVFSITVDLLLALAPVLVLRTLQMDHKRKVSLGIMFGLGTLAIGGTTSRSVMFVVAVRHDRDFTWFWAPAELCSVLESSLGIFFVCVPAVAPLFVDYFNSWMTTPRNQHQHRDADEHSAQLRHAKAGAGGGGGGRAHEKKDVLVTFGQIPLRRPGRRPDDESLLAPTQLSVLDRCKSRDGDDSSDGGGHHDGSYEMSEFRATDDDEEGNDNDDERGGDGSGRASPASQRRFFESPRLSRRGSVDDDPDLESGQEQGTRVDVLRPDDEGAPHAM